MTRRARATNALLVVASVALIVLLLEAAARLFLPVADIPWHVGDDTLGYRLVPDQSGRFAGEGAVASFRINRSGYNNEHAYDAPRVAGRARIAVLGDSFVEALHVDRGQRFFDRLEAKLAAEGRPAEVFTYAVSGYGTGQELLLLERDVERASPDLVIVLFVNNDLADTACVVRRTTDLPCFRIDGQGRLATEPADAHRPNRLARLGMRSALARYLLINRDLLGAWRRLRTGPVVPSWVQTYAVAPPPDWEMAWSVVESSLAAMAERCRRLGAPLVVIHQPILSRQFEEHVKSLEGGGDSALPATRLAAFAARHGFTFLDLTTSFEAAGGGAPKRFQTPRGDHWNAEAHAIAASALVAPVLHLLAQAPATGSYGEQTSRSAAARPGPNEPGPHVFVPRTR